MTQSPGLVCSAKARWRWAPGSTSPAMGTGMGTHGADGAAGGLERGEGHLPGGAQVGPILPPGAG